ncbi:MAG: DUF2156 domain-containing protein [Desulfuromonadales bacterium]|nr:DUF2156 domain-containing protein [Desulfuromonadales bacterium]
MEIPAYPHSRPLDISDKPLLDRIFQELQPRVSELTFAGLYLFRNAHGYSLTMLDNALVVLGRGYDGLSYFLPPLNAGIPHALDVLFSQGMELYAADELFVSRYLACRELEVVEDRNSFDYLYLRDELATLPGNRLHKKKNRVNYFAKRHAYRVELFARSHSEGCRELLEVWRSMAETEQNASLALEVAAADEALELADALELMGVVVIVEDRVRAFSLGELLNRETAVCHFEKADPFMEGLSQVVNQAFASRLFGECRFVNREQDLGEPGLRNAKLSYHPLELVKKYRVRRYAHS